MPNLHPFLVHFPLALYLTGFLFDVIGLLRKNESFVRTGWYLAAAAFIGGLLAAGSGLYAKGSVAVPAAAQDSFDSHEQLAFLAITAMTGVAFWRLRSRGGIPVRLRWAYLLLALLAAGLLTATGLLGGSLVFEFGVGVR
jgi:uncharacterized membrane protein